MKCSALLLSLAFLLGIQGCSSKHISNANLDQVKPEMNSKEVESILGLPTRTETPLDSKSQEVKTAQVTRYVYEQDGNKVELTFIGDRLMSGGIKGNFGK